MARTLLMRVLSLALALTLALALAFGLPSGPAPAAGSVPETRMTAAVVEFQVRGGLDEQSGAIIADQMMAAIANTGRFILRDRLPLSAAAKIAKASELGETGLLDPKTAAELGRLYGLDAVVTGGVYKLGDLITVTARLIDTKTASLLRSGQIQGKDIDTIQIKINELATMVTVAPEAPEAPKTYALTVKTDPADASVRLPNSLKPYQPSVQLAVGEYDIEIARSGYVTRKEKLRITDRDLTLTIALEKAKYGLTVRPNPPDAQIQLLNSPVAYQPGVALAPGDYEVEAARDGYVTRKFPVRIVDGDIVVQVALEKAPPPPPPQYRLIVLADPPQAVTRLLNSPIAYQSGVQLPPGDYQIEVTLAGYETVRTSVRIANSDVTFPVRLTKTAPPPPKTYRLTVQPEPTTAQVRLVDSSTTYQPGVLLPPGRYTVEVTQAGYEPGWVTVQIVDSDVLAPVRLTRKPEPAQYRLTVRTDPADARVRLLNAKTAYQPGVALAPGNYTVEVSRPGYEAKQIPIRIADSDVTVPVTLAKEAKPEQYRLTVRTDPANARVKLLGIKTAYKPGIALAPGSYTVEVSQPGYETKQAPVRIVDSDATIAVTLAKLPEPTQYRLTVQTDPPGAQVRLRGTKARYRPGVALPPGTYTVEVSQKGYESQRATARIVDSDATVSVTLVKLPEPTQYRLTVQTDPPGAQVRLRGMQTRYRPGVSLMPGSYTVEVSQPGYETRQVPVRIADGDATISVTLVKSPEPTQYRLTVRPEPADARVRLVNSSFTYRSGVSLPPGDYVVEVTGRGYQAKRVPVRISDGDVTLPVELERIATATPTPTTPTRPGEWRISAVSAGSLDGPDRSEFMRIFGGYVGQTVTRSTLLSGALRFYQSTGVTLGFIVQTNASGTAELSARAARRVRRTYETTTFPSMTPSQLENSGFGVSVQ